MSICDELVNKNIIEDIKEYEIEEYKFFKQINKILTNIEKSIVIFIDALDQLQFKDSLEWLPEKLNENIKIVFSVLKDEKYKELKTQITYEKYHLDLIIDGGNFVRYKNKAIMTDKIFKENSSKSKDEIISTIKSICRLNELIIIPK